MMHFESKEEILATAALDPELAKYLSEGPPLPSIDSHNINAFIKSARAGQSARVQALGQPPAGVVQSDTTYTTRDGERLHAKVYQPAGLSKKQAPLVLLFHGGGFCTGLPEFEELTARNLVLQLGAVCVSASYRLGPEHPFPQAPEDAWDALRWAAGQFDALGATSSAGFIVAGSSAGANLATVVAHRARDEQLSPALTGQFLAIPTVCPISVMPEKYQCDYYSWEQNKDAIGLPAVAAEGFFRAYNADYADNTRFAILNHPKGHAGLPPTVVVAAGADPLRDEALIYEKVLREEYGVVTRLFLYSGMPHTFWSIFPSLKQSDQFRKDQIEAFRWLLAVR